MLKIRLLVAVEWVALVVGFSGTTLAAPETLQTYRDDLFGIEFNFPRSLVARACPAYEDQENLTCIVCFSRAKYPNQEDCYATVSVSILPIEEVAKKSGWQQVRPEDLVDNGLRTLPENWLAGDWQIPTRGIPEPAQVVEYSSWKGLIGSGLASITVSDGGTCSACASSYTAIVTDGRITVAMDYVTDGDYPEYDAENTLDVMLHSLQRVSNDSSANMKMPPHRE